MSTLNSMIGQNVRIIPTNRISTSGGTMLYPLLRNALFSMDAEVAHERTAALLRMASRTPGMAVMMRRIFRPATQGLSQQIAGMTVGHTHVTIA